MARDVTFPELGIVHVKRGARGTCPGSGSPAPTGNWTRCDHCGRKLQPTTHRRLPTHKKFIYSMGTPQQWGKR